MNKVVVIDVDGTIEKAVYSAIESAGGFDHESGAKIVIKPNLCSSKKSSECGVNTNIEVVESVIKYINNKCKSEISIVEGNSDGTADEAFERMGYKELENRYSNVSCVNLSDDETHKLILKNSKKLRTLEIPSTLLFMDSFISVAKLKRHVFERYTGIWKNQYGCIPDKRVRPVLHPFLTKVLYDLNSVYYPDLSIIDGTIGLCGPGPIEGLPKKANKIICGKNPLSTDIVGAKLIGVDYTQVPHLKYAVSNGHKDAKNIEIMGDVTVSEPFKFITPLQYRMYRASLFFGRASYYINNASDIIAATAFALRAIGFSQLAEGRVLSTRDMINELKELLFKLEASKKVG
jgi:uncharacterized protein (DUF362 family)